MNTSVPVWIRFFGIMTFAALGFWLLGMSFNVLPDFGGNLVSPRWIAGVAGFISCLCASFLALDFAPDRFGVARQFLMLMFFCGLAAAFSWVAFGDGVRVFGESQGISLGRGHDVSAREGRVAFSVLAVLSSILTLATSWRLLTRLVDHLLRAWRASRPSVAAPDAEN